MKKQILNSIANTHISSDPEYFRLYKQWQQISEQIRFLTEENHNINVENQNMKKQHNKLRAIFHSVSADIIKRKPPNIMSGQIKTRMRINQLKNKAKGHEFEIKKLYEEQKSFKAENKEEKCIEMLMEQIDVNSEILKYNLSSVLKKGMAVKMPVLKNHELDDLNEDDCNRIEELKNSKRDALMRLKAEVLTVEQEIEKELKIQSTMLQSKSKGADFLKQYNKLMEIRGKEKKENDNLTELIRTLNSKIQQIKDDLENLNKSNQDIKLKLVVKKEHEMKQNKNLKEEIEKYTQQCVEVRAKYENLLRMRNVKKSMEEVASLK